MARRSSRSGSAQHESAAASILAPKQTPGHRLAAGALIIVVAVLIAYTPAIKGGFVWDDDSYVTDNVHLRTAGGLAHLWFDVGATPQYYPAVFTSFWIEYHLWGYQPLGYHLSNAMLHALGAVLLWLVLRQLSVPGAWLAAAVFALHPVQVESVAWITERKNVLSGVFYFAALLAYVRFSDLGWDRRPDRLRWRYFGLSVLLFCLALLSKTVTCSLPAAILLVLWWKRKRLDLRETLPLVPMFAAGLAMGLLTVWLERNTVGAQGAEWSLTLIDRFLLAGRIAWFYLGKLLWPATLTFFYPKWTVDAASWWQYLYPLAAVALLVTLWRLRHRLGRGWLVAALFFGGTLLPALGFFDVYPMRYSYVADHFQYLASVGPIAALAALVSVGLGLHRTKSPAALVARSAFPAGLLVLLATLTWRQGLIYQDLETLWRDTLDKNPNAWMAHNNLGAVLKGRGQVDQAIAHYRKAVEINPDCLRAHGNLATILLDRGEIDASLEHWKEAVRLRPRRFPQPYYEMGDLLRDRGRFGDAIEQYRRALELDPGLIDVRTNLAAALVDSGRVTEAVTECRRVLESEPRRAAAHLHLGRAAFRQDKVEEAIARYRRTLEIDPALASAHYQLGLALFRVKQVDRAVEHYREAVRLDPEYAEAHHNLGVALAVQGHLDRALVSFQEAVRLKPDFAEALRGLGLALAGQGHIEAAVEQWRRAVQVAPTNVRLRCLLADHLMQLGRPQEAAVHYRQALALDPNCQDARRGLQGASGSSEPRSEE